VRAATPGLIAALDAEVTTVALVARIARRDGVLLAWTSSDEAVELDGVRHEPSPGLTLSAIDLDGDEAGDLAGALSDDAMSPADLATGRFDGARVVLALADAMQPELGEMVLSSGRIARVEARDEAFTATLRTALGALDASPVALCAPECRAHLGDPQCRVNLSARRTLARVTASAGIALEHDRPAGAANAFAYGRVRALTCAVSGLERGVVESTAGQVTLDAQLDGLAPGDCIELTEGCDKRFATCRDRFGNALNFQGEPHVPGGDAVTRYAGL
jgi:uncharacterized phage protein (TIGR02218 family)